MPKLYTTDRILRFGDCDISGTAYYPAYMNILNNVNEEFWEHIGFPWHTTIKEHGWGTPTVHLSCDFNKTSSFGETLHFEMAILRVGTSSVTIKHRISCEGETRWICKQVLVASDLAKLSAIPFPDDVRAALLDCHVKADEIDF